MEALHKVVLEALHKVVLEALHKVVLVALHKVVLVALHKVVLVAPHKVVLVALHKVVLVALHKVVLVALHKVVLVVSHRVAMSNMVLVVVVVVRTKRKENPASMTPTVVINDALFLTLKETRSNSTVVLVVPHRVAMSNLVLVVMVRTKRKENPASMTPTVIINDVLFLTLKESSKTVVLAAPLYKVVLEARG